MTDDPKWENDAARSQENRVKGSWKNKPVVQYLAIIWCIGGFFVLTKLMALQQDLPLRPGILGPGYFQWKYRSSITAARDGDPEAQEKIARLYEDGAGVKQDTAEAYFWYSLAAKQNASDARKKNSAMLRLTPEQRMAVDKRVAAWKPVATPAPVPK